MKGFKDRKVEIGGKSEVYFNLHKNVFSLKQFGLVVLHAPTVTLEDVTFKVREAGRQRVLKEKRKNVHATVLGQFVTQQPRDIPEGYREAYYNPYKTKFFIDKETGKPLIHAKSVILKDKKIFYK